MKTFVCQCGQQLFFENTHCAQCSRTLGYDPQTASMQALERTGEADLWRNDAGAFYRQCQNYSDHHVCNWVVSATTPATYCLSCRLNQMIPSLADPENRQWWARMEASKRRLLYSLLRLGLPVKPRDEFPDDGLGFAFIEDQRSNPGVEQEYVLTGHADGLITVNLIEADEISLEWQRVSLGEPYRTLLGHFRHESGHYYFDLLLKNSGYEANAYLEEFRQLFGDERGDYATALKRYYSGEPMELFSDGFISRYAQAHPLEDWAECWAHYLHLNDTLETAVSYGLVNADVLQLDFSEQIQHWIKLSLALNGLNRSMGLSDAYPFVLSAGVIEKLLFVNRLILGEGFTGQGLG